MPDNDPPTRHYRWDPRKLGCGYNVRTMSTPHPIELVFRHVDGIDISMDIYLPKETSAKSIPVILWWHGGGLIQGTRKGISPHLVLAPDRHQLCVVSADYRLAPQSRFPEILSDCKAAIDFLHSPSFRAATNNRVDASKLVVSGSSAGGWLSLLVGNGIGYEACGLESPASQVRGIAAIYPISALNDPFWTDKKEKAAYFERTIAHEEMAEYLDPKAPKVASSSLDSPRWMFYTYMVQEGILADLLLGGTSISPEEFSVGPQIKIGRFTPAPTYLVHGTIDTKVPFSQATAVVDAYKEKGVDVDFHVMTVEHGFDGAGMYRLDRMYDFVKKVVR
ncbi:hypothetical protein PTI98_007236 [Pleurotus ostreatus]|nr:hypothetical protein PTI98_007236 [Pleurotus ostreatus]